MPANLRLAGNDSANASEARHCEPLIAGQLGRDAVDNVSQIHAAFLKSAGAALSELFQISVPLTLREAMQTPFSQVLRDIGSEHHLIALDLAPLQGVGFLTFPKPLLFRILDILLATPENSFTETPPDESQRMVTGIELHILREFFDVLTSALRKAWEPFYPVAFRQISGDEKPESLAAEYGDNLALNLRASVELSGMTAEILLVVPVFLARLAGLSGTPVSSSAASQAAWGSIFNCVSGAKVRVDGVLEGASIRIRNLIDLVPNQILVLGDSESRPVSCLINSQRGFTGELIVSRGRYAIQVDNMPDAVASRGVQGQFTDESATDK